MKKIAAILLLLFAIPTRAAERDFMSWFYLGRPYIDDPLGENSGIDSDPLIRTDAFDCMTFVETMFANNDEKLLTKIRYKNGKIDIKNRNHFFELWVGENNSIVEPATMSLSEKILGKPAHERITPINFTSWFKKKFGIDYVAKNAVVPVEYISYDDILAHKKEFTQALDAPYVVAFVKDRDITTIEKIGTDIAITHVGFYFPRANIGSGPVVREHILRHASSTAGKVVDIDFFEYAERRKKMPGNLGVAFYKVKD